MENESQINSLEALEKLDKVLEFINSIERPHFRTFGELQSELSDAKIDLGVYSKELDLILDKLELDGMIRVELVDRDSNFLKPGRIKRYYPSFNGVVFIQNGGYVRKVTKLAIEKEQVKLLQKQTHRYTFWTAFGAVSIVVIEIVKLFTQDYPYFPSWKSIFK